jgi:hypothetical protein
MSDTSLQKALCSSDPPAQQRSLPGSHGAVTSNPQWLPQQVSYGDAPGAAWHEA